MSIRYTITKTGETSNGTSTYEVKYAYDKSAAILLQKDELILKKEDSSGEVFEERINVPAVSIASYAMPSSSEATMNKYNGFAVNVSDSNLAVSGVYYEVESTVGTYSNPNASSNEYPEYPEYTGPQ